MSFNSKAFSWTSVPLTLLMTMMIAAVVSAAPPGSPSAEDMLGSRVYYRNREMIPAPEDNMVSITSSDPDQPTVPVMFEPRTLSLPPSENALLSYLLARRLSLGTNRIMRPSLDIPSDQRTVERRDQSKKDQRKIYFRCYFNAISCF